VANATALPLAARSRGLGAPDTAGPRSRSVTCSRAASATYRARPGCPGSGSNSQRGRGTGEPGRS
jgi:hypothetical protein